MLDYSALTELEWLPVPGLTVTAPVKTVDV